MLLKRIALLILCAMLPLSLWADLTDSQATAKAKSLWGAKGRIGHGRDVTDSYWLQQVGMNTTCGNPSDPASVSFSVMGAAPNTWNAAFGAVPFNNIWGPYSGAISLNAQAWDNVGIVEMQFRIDNVALPVIIKTAGRAWTAEASGNKATLLILATSDWTVAQTWNSASVPNGVHYLCVTARDAAGNLSRSLPFIFRTNQAEPTAATWMTIPSKGSPVFATLPPAVKSSK